MNSERDLENMAYILCCVIGAGIFISMSGIILATTDLHEHVSYAIDIIKNIIYSVKSSDLNLLIEIPILIFLRFIINAYYKHLDD